MDEAVTCGYLPAFALVRGVQPPGMVAGDRSWGGSGARCAGLWLSCCCHPVQRDWFGRRGKAAGLADEPSGFAAFVAFVAFAFCIA
jgi:hypothetical protein